MSRSRSAAAVSREELERRRRELNDQAADLKRRIRNDKEKLHSVAAMRRELIEEYKQFGIEVVIVAPIENGQGVEETHGRTEDEANREQTAYAKPLEETGNEETPDD